MLNFILRIFALLLDTIRGRVSVPIACPSFSRTPSFPYSRLVFETAVLPVTFEYRHR